MNDSTDQTAAAVESRSSDGASAAPAGPRPVPAAQARPTPAPLGVGLQDFLTSGETRLRDLLAFGLAVEAGRMPTSDGIVALHRKAEAELEAHAFRVMHNQAEQIRRQAVDDHIARAPKGLTVVGATFATMVGITLFLALLTLIWLAAPNLFGELLAHLAQLAARLHPGT